MDQAMDRKHFDPHTDMPPAQWPVSMQPSLYAPHLDVTRARLGFGRRGLRLLNRDLHSKDRLVQLQALHTVVDQVQICENAIFLIDLQVVYRLIDLMHNRNPLIREKVCHALTHLADYQQGRQRILSSPGFIENLLSLIADDRKEIRYAAAVTLNNLATDRCSCEIITRTTDIAKHLLSIVLSEHATIIVQHLETLANLAEWDPVSALKANGFQVMLALIGNEKPKLVSRAMDCLTQLCKHEVGRKLADVHDLTHVLLDHVKSPHLEIVYSAVSLMSFTTLTVRSKWRAREFCDELTRLLISLLDCHNEPPLQIRCLQVLTNLCDSPDIRCVMNNWEDRIKHMKIRTKEQWDGTSEATSYGLETGHNYRTMFIETVETIHNDYSEDATVINVHSYLESVAEAKETLLKAINWKPYDN